MIRSNNSDAVQQEYISYDDYISKKLEVLDNITKNYPKFSNKYLDSNSYTYQFSKALDIENRYSILSEKKRIDISKRCTIVEEENKTWIELKEKLRDRELDDAIILFWKNNSLIEKEVNINDSQYIDIDQNFIKQYLGKVLIEQNVKRYDEWYDKEISFIQTIYEPLNNVQIFITESKNSVTVQRMKETLIKCQEQFYRTEQIISKIIQGKVSQVLNQDNYAQSYYDNYGMYSRYPYTSKYQSDHLNDSQNLACQIAQSNSISLIQGCPGGGKTTTSAHIIKSMMNKFRSILVCAGTNIAADNLCIAMKKLGIEFTRVCALTIEEYSSEGKYQKYQVHSDVKDYEIHAKCQLRLQPLLQQLNQKYSLHEAKRQKINKNLNMTKYSRYQEYDEDEYFYDSLTGFNKADFDLLKTFMNKPPSIRFINCNRSKEVSSKAFEHYRMLYSQIFSESKIVVSTCATSGDKRFADRTFEFCLLDESSQCIEPEQLIPIVHGCNHVVLVGDQNQLGPVVQCQNLVNAGYDMSLFQRLVYCGFPITPLNIQYRMHPALIEYSNIKYYKGIINSGIKAESRLLEQKNSLNGQIITNSFPSLMINVNGKEDFDKDTKSYSNKQECELTLELISYILRTYNVKEEDIGVITPYIQQKFLIQEQLKNIHLNEVEVNSVDSFQGREKKIIILSFVRTDNSGFTSDQKRLNVSLTRCQYQLYILCNVQCMNKNEELKQLVNFYESKQALEHTSTLYSKIQIQKAPKTSQNIVPKQNKVNIIQNNELTIIQKKSKQQNKRGQDIKITIDKQVEEVPLVQFIPKEVIQQAKQKAQITKQPKTEEATKTNKKYKRISLEL
ncbi:DNA_helicase [Hexamita inflata]|uniref:Putative n=1 Tax=Hexamita inflata TaxID=28002 RepID=A0AA86P9A3_9EUKA|nr:DNA helicase [Hexamita inflata]